MSNLPACLWNRRGAAPGKAPLNPPQPNTHAAYHMRDVAAVAEILPVCHPRPVCLLIALHDLGRLGVSFAIQSFRTVSTGK